MDVGELLALIVGFTALILVIVFRLRDRERQVETLTNELKTIKGDLKGGFDSFEKATLARFEALYNNAERTFKNSEFVLNKLAELPSLKVRPDLSAYLANQWDFIEKTFRYRYAKHDICRRIVSEYISNNSTILLDSGSTVDLVTYELLGAHVKKVKVHSNNIFAAMHLVGTDPVEFHILSGIFSEQFAAVYSKNAINIISQLGIDLFILAATAIRFETGVMCSRQDRANREFKEAILRAFVGAKNSRLIIAVDASKFIEPTEKHNGVIEKDEWLEVVDNHRNRMVVVTSRVPKELEKREAEINREIQKFKDSEIKVDQGLQIPNSVNTQSK